MCAPRKPVDMAAAIAAITSVADSLSVPSSSAETLAMIASYARMWTRVRRRAEVLTHGLVAESRCSIERESD